MLVVAILLGVVLLGPPGPAETAPPVATTPPAALESEPEPGPKTHGQLRLIVLIHGTRDALPGARLFELAASDDTNDPDRHEAPETDSSGSVQLWLEPGPHKFSVRADGYEPLEFDVTITAGEAQTLELRVDEALGGNRYRTVVHTNRPVGISRTTLREQELHEVPGSGGDPFGVIKSLPGAAQVSGFLPYVVVRGAAPGNTGYYLDGIRVPALFHVAVGPSVIHPYFIDEVDFYQSGAPVRLGRYASGIVEGRTRSAARDRLRGEVDLRLTDAGALLEIPFDRPRDPTCRRDHKRLPTCLKPGRGALTLGGRYSYTGLILSAIPALNVNIRFWDYQARLDHDLGPRARYTAFVFGSYDELGQRSAVVFDLDDEGNQTQTIDDNPDPLVRLEFHRIDQRIRQRVRNGGRIDYRVTLGLDRSGVQSIRVDQWRVAPRIDAQLRVSDRVTLHTGLDQELQIFRLPRNIDTELLTNAVEDLALLLSERTVSVTALYFDLAYRKGPLEIRPGIRGDLWISVGTSPYLSEASAVSSAIGFDPRVQVREQVSEHVSLRQSLGLYHQAPDPPLPIPGIESVGLDDGLQRNTQGSFGWTWEIADRAVLSQDAYLGRLTNMQDYELSQGLDASGDTSTSDELDDYLIRVSGWSWGLETMLRLVPDGKVYGWLAYTLSWSLRDYPLGGLAPATWDQRHIFNAVLGWNVNRKWRVGGRLHINSGRPYTTRTLDDNGALEDLITAWTEHRNDARMPAFMQLDVRVERIFMLREFRLHLYLDVANANFAREVLRCDSLAQSNFGAPVNDGCVNPQALRYMLPTLGLRAVF